MTRLEEIRQRVERAKDDDAPMEAIAALLTNARQDIPALLAAVEAAVKFRGLDSRRKPQGIQKQVARKMIDATLAPLLQDMDATL